ncbi:c-type cytochrome [Aurantiacibacter gangjinensis]|uniref:Uncharacterized protein n=1 Tax=Aurantiacibacter gangjinensis TaxID=502682 RepID=A0A0G9MKA9_9SPHN|nr:cytochrome c family protein [Aurantiacibacter gangjinensis]APE29312.1 membrane c-type cytochrome cy [Aurantiacibacter gangjinensis]KLE31099.1 hypothetical protein AAW01_12740 [Aurantiacibacter gangjinensis]
MNDRNNTIFGWVLFSGVVALGASIASATYFQADDPELPEGVEPGYFIEGAVAGAEEDVLPVAYYLNQGTAAAGEGVFARCQACHNVNAGGANGLGPALHGIVGAPKAAVAGFDYSSALTEMGGEWTFENLDAWLANPRQYAPGNKMSFPGLSDPQARADVILYMRENGGGPPIPEYVEEAPAEGEGDEDAGVEEGVTGEAAGTAAEQNAEGDTLTATEISQ